MQLLAFLKQRKIAMLKFSSSALILAALLSAPALAGPPVAPNLQTFTVDDLKAALADANAQTPPDTRHGQCWEAAIPVVENFQLQLKQGLPAGPGLAQLMQKTFNLKSSKSQIPDALVQACALTLADLNLTLAQFAGMIGVHAITLPKLPIP
jgi:hypothetical protein